MLVCGAQNNVTLQSLKLNGNKMGDRGAMYVAQMLQLNTTLEQLDLGECELGVASLIALATVMRYNTRVRALTLNRPLLWTHQEEHVYHIAQMLQACHSPPLAQSSLFPSAPLAANLCQSYALRERSIDSSIAFATGEQHAQRAPPAEVLRDRLGLRAARRGT